MDAVDKTDRLTEIFVEGSTPRVFYPGCVRCALESGRGNFSLEVSNDILVISGPCKLVFFQINMSVKILTARMMRVVSCINPPFPHSGANGSNDSRFKETDTDTLDASKYFTQT